ncbi:HNH endonuclease [Psychroserpens burtonensis]|uniref:HNH endonuclease n=1 Tax=Psychroserpens burtonensis TaxID=49278 RepID=A0A5C7B1B0_9FLAO|nr:HNH endonuclease [Psychroserpens burtonensis]TXE14896.1 HNH endonuclease [Psychroserpens burtonensis]
MKLIDNINQLIENLNTLEGYLSEGTEYESEQATSLVQKGRCFVAYKVKRELRFAPSRFIGYISNELDVHDKSHKDGRETNREINKILKSKPEPNEKLEKRYLSYLNDLGIKTENRIHKFWQLELKDDFSSNENSDEEFPEGKIVERKHKRRERNSKVVKLAKTQFKNTHGKLFCEVCKLDFEEKYGELGTDFIEAHHTIPVSEMKAEHKTKIEDFAMLCANCHRMVHKKRPWLNINELKEILK